MKRLFRPSLARRLFLSMVIAFLLAGAVLVAREYFKFKDQMSGDGSSLGKFGRALLAQLDTVDQASQAQHLVGSMLVVVNTLREGNEIPLAPIRVQLFSADGEPVFVSESLPDHLLEVPAGELRETVLGGLRYQLHAGDSPRWRLRIAEPLLEDHVVLKWLAHQILGPDLLLSFPLVLFPVWFGIHQGLRPLRRLARRIAARDPDDLSAVGVDLKYAELRVVVEAFDVLISKLRLKVQRERAFVQDAAHEMRTPMAVIAAQAHVLSRATTDAECESARRALEDAVGRASHLTHQLLELATFDRPREVEPAPIDIAALLQQMLAGFVPQALERGIELSLEAPDSLPARLDQAAFRSVAENLVDNALRYVPSGGQVVVSLSSGASGLILDVADDGPGIPAAERPHVFERFYRGSGHDMPGTGLGLAIVHGAANAMGGSVALSDGLAGRGVGFRVQIPLCAPSMHYEKR